MSTVMSVFTCVLLVFSQTGEERQRWRPEGVLAEIKLPTDGELITLRVEVDEFRGTFALDTGSNITVLNDHAAGGIDASTARLKRRTIDKMVIAGIRASDVKSIAVADFSRISTADFRIDGIIGVDILYNYLLYLDPDSEAVLICDSARTGRPPGKELALSQDNLDRPTIDFGVGNEASASFLIDTGMTSSSTATTMLFERLREDADNHSTGIRGQAIDFDGNVLIREQFRIKTSILGGFKLKDTVVSLGQRNAIGLQTLSRFKVAFDFPTAKSYWSCATRYGARDRGDCCGMSLMPIGGDGLKIDYIAKNSEADKSGLRENDEIVAINGANIMTKSKAQWHRYLSFPTCDAITLSVKRDSSVHSVVIRP